MRTRFNSIWYPFADKNRPFLDNAGKVCKSAPWICVRNSKRFKTAAKNKVCDIIHNSLTCMKSRLIVNRRKQYGLDLAKLYIGKEERMRMRK